MSTDVLREAAEMTRATYYELVNAIAPVLDPYISALASSLVNTYRETVNAVAPIIESRFPALASSIAEAHRLLEHALATVGSETWLYLTSMVAAVLVAFFVGCACRRSRQQKALPGKSQTKASKSTAVGKSKQLRVRMCKYCAAMRLDHTTTPCAHFAPSDDSPRLMRLSLKPHARRQC